MRVAMLTPLFLPVRAGTEVHVYNLSKHLMELGVKVEVHTTRDTYLERGKLSPREIIDGIPVFRHRKMWGAVRSEILHFHNLGKKFSAWNLYTIASTPLIHTRTAVLTPHHMLTIDRGELARILSKILVRAVDALVAVSQWEREEMVKRGVPASKIRVIPNGVEDEAFLYPRKEGEEDFLVYVGRIYPKKGQDFAIRGLAKVDGMKLVLVGQVQDPSYLQSLKDLTKRLGLEDRVKFLGEVSNVKKYELIDRSMALVLTSEIEAEGIAVKEAMARGKPVVVRKATALPHLVKEGINGFVVQNEEEFAEAVRKLKDPNLRKSMGRINEEEALKWRWTTVAKLTKELYEEIS